MKAHEVLETHLRVLKALGSSYFKLYLEQVTREERITKAFADEGGHLADFMLATAAEAPTIWATSDLVAQVFSTARGYDEDSIVDPIMFPDSHHGVAVLDKPLVYMDVMGRDEVVHLVTWGSLAIPNDLGEVEDVDGTGFVHAWQVMLWNDASRQPDGATRQQLGVWRSEGKYRYIEESRNLFPIKSFVFAPGHTIIDKMKMEVSKDIRERHSAEGYNPPRMLINNGRIALAVLDLIARDPEPGDQVEGEEPRARATADIGQSMTRKAEKAGLELGIRVVPYHRHRRPRREPDPNRVKRTRKPVEHHVYVPQHTRMQAYGPGRSLRREITIEAYDYGPEDPPKYTRPPTVYKADGAR